MIQKLNEQLAKKMNPAAKGPTTQAFTSGIDLTSQVSRPHSDGGSMNFDVLMAQGQMEIQRQLSEEVTELKKCLKRLQDELFEIVDLKTDIYNKRFRAELERDAESEE